MSAELPAEIIAVGKPAPVGDFPDAEFRIQKKHGTFFESENDQIFIGGISRMRLEHPGQRALGNHDRTGHFKTCPRAFRLLRHAVDQFRDPDECFFPAG